MPWLRPGWLCQALPWRVARDDWAFALLFSSLSSEDQLPPGFPNIDMGPQLKVVERTRTATMLCAASGNPDPEITWFKDFLPVDPSASNGRIKQLRSGECRWQEDLGATEGSRGRAAPPGPRPCGLMGGREVEMGASRGGH